jgi:hypothetical protein
MREDTVIATLHEDAVEIAFLATIQDLAGYTPEQEQADAMLAVGWRADLVERAARIGEHARVLNTGMAQEMHARAIQGAASQAVNADNEALPISYRGPYIVPTDADVARARETVDVPQAIVRAMIGAASGNAMATGLPVEVILDWLAVASLSGDRAGLDRFFHLRRINDPKSSALRAWHAQVPSPLAPLAWAAGMTVEDAAVAHAAGDLRYESLRVLAGLHGYLV